MIEDKMSKYQINLEEIKNINNGFLNELRKNYQFFKKVYIVHSLRDYVTFINEILLKYCYTNHSKKIRESFVFRGISNFDQLKPKVLRENSDINEEFIYIKKFEENACMKLGQFNNPIDLAAAAQHYGVKTRLLDWSYSPYVATLFSLYDDNKGYYGLVIKNSKFGVVLESLPEKNEKYLTLSQRYANMILNYEELIKVKNKIPIDVCKRYARLSNKNFIDYIYDNGTDKKIILENDTKLNIQKIVEFFMEIINKTNIIFDEYEKRDKAITLTRKCLINDASIFIKTNFSNERLRNQRGLFEIVNIKNFNVENIFNNSELLLIPQNVRKEIIKYINNVGINYYTLMDDPMNCSETINRTVTKNLSFDRLLEY